MIFADIILPLSIAQSYTYSIPAHMQELVSPGMRVIVPLGKYKYYTGIVLNVHDSDPHFPNIKPIEEVIDDRPILLPEQLQLWIFIANYYCASLADVYRNLLPSALRIESEQEIALVDEMLTADTHITRRQQQIIDSLADKKTHTTAQFQITDLKYIRQLIELGIVTNQERLTDAYRPRYETYVALSETYRSASQLGEAMTQLKPAKKQLEALEQYIELAPDFSPIARSLLTKQYNLKAPIIKALIDKGIFQQSSRQTNRIDVDSLPSSSCCQLTPAQTKAKKDIVEKWNSHNVVLLHGVADSGKTEIYSHLIADCISSGGQVLLLEPEVGTARRISARLKPYFGGKMGTYHSQCSNFERVEIYNHQLGDNPYQIIVGVRSAIFLPYKNLKLVIVDDEHDALYKQNEPSPRYQGRDTAIYLATLYGAKVLLASATPSIDSYANCHSGKYGLVELSKRYHQSSTAVELTDMTLCRKQRRLKGHFSFEMLDAIQSALNAHRQVIVFQNRRGFAPYAECTACGYVPRCPNCDVSLTAHNHTHVLKCHYCGHTEPWTETCPHCKQNSLTTRGFGTEQVEAELHLFFPNANIARFDLDTSRSTRAYDRILSDMECGATNILVGTQMALKALSSSRIALVCILNADNLLFHSDFRAHERAYQIIGQAIGCTGRGGTAGRVMIQTSQPDAPVIRQAVTDNYKAFFAEQMKDRHLFHYPPYFRFIKIMVHHTDNNTCRLAAEKLSARLRLTFSSRVLGPDAPSIGRIQNQFIQQIILKIESQAPVVRAKQIIISELEALRATPQFRSARFILDIDPQ